MSGAVRADGGAAVTGLPRLADFALWVTAAEPALGWAPGTFVETYRGNRTAATDLALEASPLVSPLRALATEAGEWTGTAGELLTACSARVDDASRKAKTWPTSPRGLTNALRRLTPNLRAAGLDVRFLPREARTGRRLLSLRQMGDETVTRVTPVTSLIGRVGPGDAGGDDTDRSMTEGGAQPSPEMAAPDAGRDDGDGGDDPIRRPSGRTPAGAGASDGDGGNALRALGPSGWPDALPGQGHQQIRALNRCADCQASTWVHYGGMPLCQPCASRRAA